MTHRETISTSSMGLAMLVTVLIVAASPGVLLPAVSAEKVVSEIERLERQLFSSAGKADQIDRLLSRLENRQKRISAEEELKKLGYPFLSKIIEFARTSKDIEARQACADIVRHWGTVYRTSNLGKQLAVLYRIHAHQLLPDYWKRFRTNPLDHRAVAMLLAPRPEVVDKWVSRSADKQDRLRYLLLRVRELSPDGFSRARLQLYSDKQVLRALPNVFPIATADKKYYCKHVVGHVVFSVVDLESAWKPRNESYTGLLFLRQAVVAFRSLQYHSQIAMIHYGYRLYSYHYQSNPRSSGRYRRRRIITRGLVANFPGLYRVPELKLADSQRLEWSRNALKNPWWVKQRLSKTMQRQFRFTARKPKEAEPFATDRVEIKVATLKPFLGRVKPPSKSASAIVVLPPAVSENAHPGILQAARTACDRLAGEISADGTVQVVNRSELERILKERKTAGPINRPITAYAAMIRVEVNTDRLSPGTTVKVIDLSTGNVLGEKEFGWPLVESDVAPMKALCQSALKNASRTVAGKTRVRWLGVQNTGDQVRMKPLAIRLQSAFERALARSKNVLVVRHLEAGTSQEESLLLLMGLSRLPGGKQFTPQADATLELRVTEGNGVGKTFDQTPVLVGIRLRDAKHLTGDWIENSGIVNSFDLLIEQSWRRLAGKLTAVPSGSARDALKEMRIRRSQAEAEVRIAKDILRNATVRSEISNRTKSAVSHLETALKIDPTFPDPHLMLSQMFVGKNGIQRRVLEAEAYVMHPQSDPRYWPVALARAVYAMRFEWFSKNPRGGIDTIRENARLFSALVTLVDHAVDSRVRETNPGRLAFVIPVIDRGMRALGVSLEERVRWVDKILKELDRFEADAKAVKSFSRDTYLNGIRRARIVVAEIAIEDGLQPRAKRLLAKARVGLKPQNSELQSMLATLRRVTKRLDDKNALREFETWAASFSTSVGLISVEWPRADVWQDRVWERHRINRGVKTLSGPHRPEVPFTEIVRPKTGIYFGQYQGISPIAADKKRVYLVLSNADKSVRWVDSFGDWMELNASQIAWVQLDVSGRPIGKLTNVSIRRGRFKKKMKVWKPFHIPKQPKTENVNSYGMVFIQARKGKLYLGTQSNGLLVFDPQQKTWTTYGAQQGFPTPSASSFFFLDNENLYLAGGRFATNSQHFTLNLKTGAVKLIHKANESKKEYYITRLVPMWWDNGKLVDKLRTDLLSAKPKYRPRWRGLTIGSALDAVELDGRRFFTTKAGLYEYDVHGKTLRSWFESSTTYIGVNRHFSIPRISTTPQRGHFMVKTGKLLVFIERDKGIVAFDPKSETWYGPLGNWNVHYAVGAEHGFWLAHNPIGNRPQRRGTIYIDEQDFIRTARQSGRAYTAPQYRERLQKYAQKLPLLDRAKVSVMLRDSRRAVQILNEALAAEPDNAEALFLRGLVHDRWGLRQPKKALADYHALANHPDRSAQVTGLFFEMMVHQQSKDYPQIVRVCEKMIRDVPNLDRKLYRNIAWWLNHAKQKTR